MKKKAFTILTILLVIALAVVIVINVKNNKNEKKDNPTEIKEEAKLSDFIVDADIEYEIKEKDYVRDQESSKEDSKVNYGIEIKVNNNYQKAEDLKVPHIKLDSKDAKQINNELEELYKETMASYNLCAEESTKEDGRSCSQVLTYKAYLYKDVLSILVIKGAQSTAPWTFDFKSYALDVKTKKKLSYEEVIDKLNLNEKETTEKFNQLILEKIDNDYGDIELENDILEDSKKEATKIFNESIKNNSIEVFVNNEGKLGAILLPYYNGAQNADTQYFIFQLS